MAIDIQREVEKVLFNPRTYKISVRLKSTNEVGEDTKKYQIFD